MLSRIAVSHSLFPPTTLQDAIDRLGFVQADPIRAPARAQDLILRHRVEGYRAGDLERFYPELEVEEDYLYAYGFVSRELWRLLHPRKSGRVAVLARRVLDVVKTIGATHPRALEAQLGRRRVVNAWGSHSKATTQALDWLHYRGLVRIARRENGIRVYESIPPHPERLSPRDRLAGIVKTVANILAPALEGTLARETARYRDLGSPRAVLQELLDKGELKRHSAGTTSYIFPPDVETVSDPPRQVRFLAPFDPIVWDRRRFELFWGWPYRFEAYTPPARRVRGYYAMPLLWGDAIVGWANASIVKGKLDVNAGYIGRRPRGRAFSQELDAEVARLDEFLQPR